LVFILPVISYIQKYQSERTISMSNILGVAAIIDGGLFEVFCCNCGQSLGSMNEETLLRAALFSLKIGGIMCPDCRKRRCVDCGYVINKDYSLDDNHLCAFCAHDRNIIAGEKGENDV
jgi:hypothetical protein